VTNFDNMAAARAWLSRAKHLADQSGSAVVIGWTDLVAGYLADDPLRGREAMERAAATAEAASDPEIASMTLADLGMWHVGSGDLNRGMTMLDEAMAATLAEPGRIAAQLRQLAARSDKSADTRTRAWSGSAISH
jgi:hypothetical protein